MPVRLRAGMVTNIILPSWEASEDIVIGDGGAVEATIIRPNVIGIKSLQTGLDTSMSVIGGSGNIYTFYLRTEGRNTRVVTDLQIFVQAAPSKGGAKWFSDERRNLLGRREVVGESFAPGRSAPAADLEDDGLTLVGAADNGDEPVPAGRRIFDMKMYEVNEGDRIIAPEYVYTDGRWTYLHYSTGVTDRPAIFRNVGGIEGRVNTRIIGRSGEIVVIEAIGDFVLRSGSRTVCLRRTGEARQAAKIER
jgi:type IV secretory pathway VirB9-like protein